MATSDASKTSETSETWTALPDNAGTLPSTNAQIVLVSLVATLSVPQIQSKRQLAPTLTAIRSLSCTLSNYTLDTLLAMIDCTQY